MGASAELRHNRTAPSIGSALTKLVILRGDSASGKTSAALALRERLGPKVAVLHQDYFRREMLSGLTSSLDASLMIITSARQALDLGYDLILDGIFNLRDYAVPIERLAVDHAGATLICQFDVGLDETIRRHENRPLREEFGPEMLREWYDGWQPLPSAAEMRVTADVSTADLVDRILLDLSSSNPD